jgi:aspartokinase
MENKIRVNGIKLSSELVQVNLMQRDDKKDLNALFLKSLAENRINVPFLSCTTLGTRTQMSYCVASEDFEQLQRILALDPDLQKNAELISSVGCVSIFPHAFSLKFIGLLMHVFAMVRLPLYGIATSLSAVTLTTNFHQLDMAITSLHPHIKLPSNHAPFATKASEIRIERN